LKGLGEVLRDAFGSNLERRQAPHRYYGCAKARPQIHRRQHV